MNNKMLRLAVVAVAVTAAAAACDKKDSNSITGSSDYTSVALSSDPASFILHVHLVPQKIDTASSGVIDTVPAHDEAVDSIAFNPVAKIEPQDVPIANGLANMTFASTVASVNSSSYVQGDTTGTGTLTVTYTDVNHGFATTTLDLPVTVTEVP